MRVESKKFFKKALRKNQYIQGFNAVPLFLNIAGLSGFAMKKKLGFGYSQFNFDYQDGYCEMGYLEDDLKRIWKIVKNKIRKDRKYLEKIANSYFETFKRHEKFFSLLDIPGLRIIDERNLIRIFKRCAEAMSDSVGVAHIVDSVGIEIEKEFKGELFQLLKDKSKFNYYAAELTRPLELSFLAEEENELLKIKKAENKKEKLESHARKYAWLQNSYAGPKKLDANFFKDKMRSLPNVPHRPGLSKNKIIKELDLKKSIIGMINIIDFSTVWQDRRKANILKTIGYLGTMVKEIGRRANIRPELLYYMGQTDIKKISRISDIKKLKADLIRRKSGSFFVCTDNSEVILYGREYRLLQEMKHKSGKETYNKELHGSTANIGTAIGRVTICKGIESLAKVQTGDVLVSSMTRPEFMPALKKASAIITDEGGITSHAAIIARELNIPAIIGTKVATKVLKNGMLVEVKANHGIVRILR